MLNFLVDLTILVCMCIIIYALIIHNSTTTFKLINCSTLWHICGFCTPQGNSCEACKTNGLCVTTKDFFFQTSPVVFEKCSSAFYSWQVTTTWLEIIPQNHAKISLWQLIPSFLHLWLETFTALLCIMWYPIMGSCYDLTKGLFALH